MTISILGFHFEVPAEARGVTDPGVGCTDWFGLFSTLIVYLTIIEYRFTIPLSSNKTISLLRV
jgi:hypothetical protein